jgi:hypothetical protein
MTYRKDPAGLARRFIDLWQDQLSAMARDGQSNEVLQQWSRFWVAAGAPPGSMTSPGGLPSGDEPTAEATAAASPTKGTETRETSARDPTSDRLPSVGPKTAGAPSGHGDVELDELTRRVRELEARLAAMESANPPAGGTPAGGSRRPARTRRPNRSLPT